MNVQLDVSFNSKRPIRKIPKLCALIHLQILLNSTSKTTLSLKKERRMQKLQHQKVFSNLVPLDDSFVDVKRKDYFLKMLQDILGLYHERSHFEWECHRLSLNLN
ncbi:hypothetical protein ACOME3_009703 [Neoechinorhynchus agilis]